jgi:C1A family cysteine protease
MRRYNWKPDKKDHRDFILKLTAPPHAPLPSKIDLRSNCSPIVDQGQLGSCTANALSALIEYIELQQLKQNLPLKKGPEELLFKAFAPASRLFIYYNERVIEGTVDEDSGAELRDGIKSLTKWGVCREQLWDYIIDNAFIKPDDEAYQHAANHKISSYWRLVSLDQMKLCLVQGYPFCFGITVYDSFESGEVASTGLVPMPGAYENILGGHAIACVGYDDSQQRLIMRNSWGTGWGDQGYFYLPYDYATNPNLASDFWTIRK